MYDNETLTNSRQIKVLTMYSILFGMCVVGALVYVLGTPFGPSTLTEKQQIVRFWVIMMGCTALLGVVASGIAIWIDSLRYNNLPLYRRLNKMF